MKSGEQEDKNECRCYPDAKEHHLQAVPLQRTFRKLAPCPLD